MGIGILETIEIPDLVQHREILVPDGVRFRDIIVTGPPGSGKSSLVSGLGGWPEEGFLDLGADEWWRHQSLTFRPREVHLGLPFAGHARSLSVTDREWLESPPRLRVERIRIPPAKRGWLSPDWRKRLAFDIQLIPSEQLFVIRRARGRAGTHPVDEGVTREMVEQQAAVYAAVAMRLHTSGMRVYVREGFDAPPRAIAAPVETSEPSGST